MAGATLLNKKWNAARLKAFRFVEDACFCGREITLIEYKSEQRFLADHPDGGPAADHNLFVRMAMREADRRRLIYTRKIVG